MEILTQKRCLGADVCGFAKRWKNPKNKFWLFGMQIDGNGEKLSEVNDFLIEIEF